MGLFLRIGALLLVCFLLTIFASISARALPEYLQAAKVAYRFKPGGTIDTKSCNLCHTGVTNATSLNFYGKDVQKVVKSAAGGTVTSALLHSLDGTDSDGDGWSNAAEFQKDTLPGDPASKPDGPPPGSLKPRESAMAGQEANPFSLEALVYPSHAQHPVIVHFPIALFIFSIFLDLLGLRTGNRTYNAAAGFNLIAGCVTGILAVITGLLAWKFAYGGESLGENRWLLFHLILAVTTTILMCLLWAIRARQPANTSYPLSRLYLVLALVTFCVIALTGHFGGILTGVVK